MKRIAILFEYPTVNGGENSMLAILDHATRDAVHSNYEFVALAPPHGSLAARLNSAGIEVVPFEVRGDQRDVPSREESLRRLASCIVRMKLDLVHANSLSMGRLLGAVTEEIDVPTTAHLRDIIRLSRSAMRDMNRNRKLIAVSAATAKFHVEQGMDPTRVSVIHNGIDVRQWSRPDSARDQLRSELGIPPEAPVILTVGQIGLRKGLDTLAAAAAVVSNSIGGVHWLLAGERFSMKQESIDYENALLNSFRSMEPILRFHRLGFRSDIAELMKAADLLVHTARQEPLGRVLIEASAASLPIIATDVGGTSEIVVNGESAVLVAPDDSAAVAQSVIRLLRNGAERDRLAARSFAVVASRFRVDDSARRLVALWDSAYR